MKKTILTILIILIISTGCSYKELNKLAIANSIGIDYSNNEYIITTQIMDLKKSSEENDSKENTLMYIGKGKTIPDALRSIELRYPSTLYLGHLELMIIGKDTIKEGIEKTFDYFLRSPEARNDTMILISEKNTANEILNPNKEKKEDFPTKDIISTIENSMDRNGTITLITLEEFLANYLRPGIDSIVPIIENEKSTNKEYKDTSITKMAIFKENKLISGINENIMKSYNTINNKYTDIVISTKYKNKNISAVILKPKSSFKTKIKNNKIDLLININASSQLVDIQGKVDPTNDKVLKEMEKQINKQMIKYTQELINFSKETNTDILGANNNIYKHYPKLYKKYKDKNIYKEANIKIKSNIKLYRYGNINRSIPGGQA